MSTPPGTILAFAGKTVPQGYLLCDGRAYTRRQFPDLADVIGGIWGGDGVNDFRVPDLRGRFLRGIDHGAGRDPDATSRKSDDGRSLGDAVGSVQDDQIQSHRHDDVGHQHQYRCPLPQADDDQANDQSSVWSTDHSAVLTTEMGKANLTDPTSADGGTPVRHGAETRTKNAYVEYIIRAVRE